MIVPEAWNKFLKEADAKRNEIGLKEGEDCLYRGHADARYSLTPSLYRFNGLNEDQYWCLESDLFYEFQARAHQLQGRGLSDWDYLFQMRHHGVPTRLLDWTENFGVAIYFAVQGYDATRGRQPCIWLLNPWGLNEESWETRDLVVPKYLGWDPVAGGYDDYGDLLASGEELRWGMPIVIYPQQTNPRLAAQRGLFTIHGNRIGPVDTLCGQYVRRVDLPLEAVEYATAWLEMAGMDEYLLFPDLDGLARALEQKYGLFDRTSAKVAAKFPVLNASHKRKLAKHL